MREIHSPNLPTTVFFSGPPWYEHAVWVDRTLFFQVLCGHTCLQLKQAVQENHSLNLPTIFFLSGMFSHNTPAVWVDRMSFF